MTNVLVGGYAEKGQTETEDATWPPQAGGSDVALGQETPGAQNTQSEKGQIFPGASEEQGSAGELISDSQALRQRFLLWEESIYFVRVAVLTSLHYRQFPTVKGRKNSLWQAALKGSACVVWFRVLGKDIMWWSVRKRIDIHFMVVGSTQCAAQRSQGKQTPRTCGSYQDPPQGPVTYFLQLGPTY